MSILSAHEISKSYKLRKVVNSLSLEIKSGEVVGLLGPNGAGKTTAFYMIVGLVSADKGQILLDGQDLTSLAMHRRSKMGLGYLPQEASVFRKLTVEQNIQAILELRDDLDRAGREQQLEDLLDELHIGHVARASASACRAASDDVSRSQEPWLRTPFSSCSMSPLPVSTRFPFSTFSALSST